MEEDYYKRFSDLTDIQLLKAIEDINGYTEEAQPILKKVALERKLVNEDLSHRVENFDEETKEFYEFTIKGVSSQQLFGMVPLKIRFYHLLIDYVGVYVFLYFAWQLLIILGYGDFLQRLNETIASVLFYFGYFFFMELLYGKTIGKFITKTKVVNYQKQRPTTNQILARSLSRLIPFEQFSFFGERPIGFHDTISRTYVIFEE